HYASPIRTHSLSLPDALPIFYNTSNFTIPGNQYNNLILNLSNSNIVATLAGDLTISGNLTINRGRLQIGNDNTSRTIQISGNILDRKSTRLNSSHVKISYAVC